MEERAAYTLTPPIEAAFTALAQKVAAEIGYTLTQEQAQALAYELAQELADSPAAQRRLAAAFCGRLVYDLEHEHPVHTWSRWAADVENDQTPPCQSYSDYVDERHHPEPVVVDGQRYLADRGTREGLDAYFSRKTGRLQPHVTPAGFARFLQDRIQQGRMNPAAAAGEEKPEPEHKSQ